MSEQPEKLSADSDPDWEIARPEHPPGMTVWPAALSFAVTLIIWGLISSLILTGFGIVMFAISMAGWIKDIRHERGQ
jgi:hypothetical protein